jgi:hypothetical protein
MKPIVLMVCTALAAVATCASAAEPRGAPIRDKALMLYFAKSFGSTQRQNRTPLQFGLKLQQSSPFDANRAVALLDARYSLGGAKTLMLAGGLSYDSGGSSAIARAHPGWTAVAIVAALAAGACLLETGLCEGDDGYERPSSPGTPQDGT